MPTDPSANAQYHAAKDIKFAVGQSVWISGLEFRVVTLIPVSDQVPNGELVIAPVGFKV